MAGRRVYGGSNAGTVFLQSERLPSQPFGALLASGSSNTGFHGSRSMVNFEDFQGNTSKRPLCHPLDFKEICTDEFDDCVQQSEKKRRLTSNQVQSLEKTFELENKLEPEKKIQLARDLGLHPRQVAIWFQNRRARWKTKQLEKDYEALKSNHDHLKADFECLLKEKEKLKAEVIVLTDKLLLKEKKGSLELFEPNNMLDLTSKPDSNSNSEEKTLEVPLPVCKQEDLSSSASAVSDSESPRCIDRLRTDIYGLTESFEAVQSDRSYVEEEEVKLCSLLKLEDNLSSYEFPVEDQAFWFWP